MKKLYVRECPNCGKSQTYAFYSSYYRAKSKNRMCASCANKAKPSSAWNHCRGTQTWKLSDESKLKISNTLRGHEVSLQTRDKLSKSITKKFKEDVVYRNKVEHSAKSRYNGESGAALKKQISNSVKKYYETDDGKNLKLKLKNLRLDTIEKYHTTENLSPCFNIHACEVIESYGKLNGYNFQHAMNGGEYRIPDIGYFVDGYDKEKNVIIEYNEPHHLYEYHSTKDNKRMEDIINKLNCKFIILQENKDGSLTEIINNVEIK